jgi:hypothetical protein
MHWGNFAAVDSGFYFVDSSTEPGSTIFYYNLKTRRQSPVVKLKLGTLPWTANLASSRDGRTLFYAQSDPKGFIMLAENFQ